MLYNQGGNKIGKIVDVKFSPKVYRYYKPLHIVGEISSKKKMYLIKPSKVEVTNEK